MSMGSITVIRPARREDARALARFYSLSSDGVASYIWSRLAQPSEDLLDIGERRFVREGTAVSFENCIVAQSDGHLTGMLLAFPSSQYSLCQQDDPVLAPLAALCEANSYYICSLNVADNYLHRGVASELLREAAIAGRREGLTKLSLIVFEQNRRAVDFYRQQGFAEGARRTVLPHPLIRYQGDALLLVRPILQFASQEKREPLN